MNNRDRLFFATVITACIVGAILVNNSDKEHAEGGLESDVGSLPLSTQKLPDFTAYQDVKEKKRAFFDFLLPLVEMENQRILQQREQLQRWQQQLAEGGVLKEKAVTQLEKIAATYEVSWQPDQLAELINNLMLRVDTIPPALALAQSANESAWGTSRFAVEGNNLFGQWCYRKGCGVVPKQRPEGSQHEVARFKSPAASVASYIRNLNTNDAYRELRVLRQQLRADNKPVTGLQLAGTLDRYSIRGAEYIKELRSMIRFNRLEEATSAPLG